MMNPAFVATLRCPITGTPLTFNAEKQALISEGAQLAFPIKDGIPILLKEHAHPLSELNANQQEKK